MGIGWMEMLLIVAVALVLLGPRNLPRVARTVGQSMRRARDMMNEATRRLREIVRELERRDL
jgi:sec-independent protein translocase protein TatB